MDDEAFWSSDPQVLRDSEWDKISSDFTNAGYREGITAGKESALQQGFDNGFANVGAPLGRELGILRGLASALLASLARSSASDGHGFASAATIEEVRAIAAALADVRFSDIAPPDLEAIAHVREHLEAQPSTSASATARMDEDDVADLMDPSRVNEELKERRDMEGLEDLMAQMTASASSGNATASAVPARPTADDVARLKDRLLAIVQGLGLSLQWS